MSARSHDGRHRAPKVATAKSRRRISGFALPTVAAVTLTFTATGAAVATAHKPHAVTVSQNTAAAAADPRSQAIDDNALDLARENAGARAARDTERQNFAARALVAEREAAAQSWQLPIKNYVLTSGFGMRWGRLHAGEDFAASVGTDLVAMSTGTVIFAGQESGYGNLVQIRYWDGTVSFYGHMARISVTKGDSLAPGQVVGQSGNSGESTGPHLHLEIHPDGGQAVAPLPWLAKRNITA